MKVLVVLLVGTMLMAGDTLPNFLDAYSDCHAALAGDNLEEAKSALEKLEKETLGMHADHLSAPAQKAWSDGVEQLKTAIKNGRAAADLEGVRKEFESIATVAISLADAAHIHGWTTFHCGMAFDGKGASWLQKGQVANPYFGSAMLRCGTAQPHKH
ncbi:MAG: DUF3347 domain-containing protein [Acidobacteria bacterium]|nr:DUF3347 domain-containing protein [Acidobacteriota bacterium]